MSTDKTREEITSADDKALGFDYQFYYFIYLLLGLEQGQTIGLEVKDDVHIDIGDSHQVLYQLKHSVQTNASGDIINLTAKDSDLWKTLSNWSLSIIDIKAGRKDKSSQLIFSGKTTFILATNKNVNIGKNEAITTILKLQAGEINITDAKAKFLGLISDPESKVDSYIRQVCSLDDDVCSLFLQNLKFEAGQDNIISKIKDKIKTKYINEGRVDVLLAGLESALRQDNYLTVVKGGQNIISFDEFYKKYCRHFELARRTNLQITKKYDFSQNAVFKNRAFDEQVFIKQLLDMGDIDSSEIDDIIGFTKQKLMAFNNLEEWIINGNLTNKEKEDFVGECISKWKIVFRKNNRQHMTKKALNSSSVLDLTDDEKFSSLDCLDATRSITLQIDGQDLGTDISNGQYYLLAEELLVGWTFDFDVRYVK
jgi:hypothetical protein